MTLSPEVVIIVWSLPPLIVYVNVKGSVPLLTENVITGLVPFKQTVVDPAIWASLGPIEMKCSKSLFILALLA